ncbi:hypothetical protein D3C85_1661770 [compost metagenome]
MRQLNNIKIPFFNIKNETPTKGAPTITIKALIIFVLIKLHACTAKPTKRSDGPTITNGNKIKGVLLICSLKATFATSLSP